MKYKYFLYKISIVLFFFVLVITSVSVPTFACPHYDEYDDEYWWLFNMDGSSTMIYIRDDHERQIILDSEFNIEHEIFSVTLFFRDSKLDQIKALETLKVNFDLSGIALNNGEEERLTGVYLKQTGNLQYDPINVSGEYSKSDAVFSFYADKPGIYSIVLLPEAISEKDNATDKEQTSKKTDDIHSDNFDNEVVDVDREDNFVSDEDVPKDTEVLDEESIVEDSIVEEEMKDEKVKEEEKDTIDSNDLNEKNPSEKVVQSEDGDIVLDFNEQAMLFDVSKIKIIIVLLSGILAVLFSLRFYKGIKNRQHANNGS